jgi:hypothetical protein
MGTACSSDDGKPPLYRAPTVARADREQPTMHQSDSYDDLASTEPAILAREHFGKQQ